MSAFVPQKTPNLFDTSLTPKKIFTLLSSTVTPKPIGTTSHYPSTPHTSFISNGCLAILLFLGIENVDVKEATCVRGQLATCTCITFTLMTLYMYNVCTCTCT